MGEHHHHARAVRNNNKRIENKRQKRRWWWWREGEWDKGGRLLGIHERNSTGRLTSVVVKERQTRETLKIISKKKKRKDM
jgi:hypothetical protein